MYQVNNFPGRAGIPKELRQIGAMFDLNAVRRVWEVQFVSRDELNSINPVRGHSSSEKARATTVGATVKILPAERGKSFYVAGRGRGSDAVHSRDPSPLRSMRWVLRENSVGNCEN